MLAGRPFFDWYGQVMDELGVFDEEDDDEDNEENDEEIVWVPLEIRLSQSEFLEQIVTHFEDWDDEARDVRGAKVRVVKEGNEHVFVVEIVVAFEAGMTVAERGGSNLAETEVGMMLRTKAV